MSYNVLGVNPGHNGSAALIVDGKVECYIEEERLSRAKYDGNPFKAMNYILSKWRVDHLVIVGTTDNLPKLPWNNEDPYYCLVRKYYPKAKLSYLGNYHHLCHASTAFFNSGFDKAFALIIDGAGSFITHNDDKNNIIFQGYETESIFLCERPNNIICFFKAIGNNYGYSYKNGFFDFDNAANLTKVYEAVTDYLGFPFIEAGKTMGLAPYGKHNDNIPPLFYKNKGGKDLFIPSYPAGAMVNSVVFEQFQREHNPQDWHDDPSRLTDIEKDLAYHVQQETQLLVSNYIDFIIKNTDIRNIILSGGYALNCVTNYFLIKKYPELNFYVEPISHDGGTSIGGATKVWQDIYVELSQTDEIFDPTPRQTTIYYGIKYEDYELNKILEENSKRIEIKNVECNEVAKLISDKNIVSIFQGRSEAGPRALGNRSILYDPRDPHGKEVVNVVKGREWFRPFAGSCLVEDAKDWFDLGSLDESPFMMYAVNVIADKIDQIPNIVHVDGTCRVQTVSEEQNKHFYNLIKSFKSITGIPILFNTSFNLAGDPLVETLQDALDTLYRSELKYLYLPELGKLVTKLD